MVKEMKVDEYDCEVNQKFINVMNDELTLNKYKSLTRDWIKKC